MLGSAESKIPLKQVLRGMIIDAFSMNRLNKTESALIGGYLFLKDLFFQIIHLLLIDNNQVDVIEAFNSFLRYRYL